MQIKDTTLSLLSWKQHDVLRPTLSAFASRCVLDLFPSRRVFFNEFDQADRDVAAEFGFEALGSASNVGIFGGAKALAAACTTEFMLFVENDCPPIVDADAFFDGMNRATADMRDHNVPVFSMRSRRQPGEKFNRRERYEKYYRLERPLREIDDGSGGQRSPTNMLQRIAEDFRRPSLRGSALFAEEAPHLRHPSCIQRSTNGNFLISSRIHNWSNNCLLVNVGFMLDVIAPRVESHPAPTTINGHQDIEAALKMGNWWKEQDVLMGQADPGPLTHARELLAQAGAGQAANIAGLHASLARM